MARWLSEEEGVSEAETKEAKEDISEAVGHFSRAPPKRKKGIQKKETARPAGHSSRVPSKRKKGIKRNETAQPAGHSSRAPPKRKKGIEKNETAQPAASDQEEYDVDEEEESNEEEEEDQQQEHEKPTKKKEKKPEKASKPLENLVNDASDSLNKICKRLDTPLAGLGNYEDVAKDFGYDVFTARARFKTSPDGPSKALILAIIAEHPDVTVERFAKVVVKQARRKDVARLLREFDSK